MKREGYGGRSKKSGWHRDARLRMGAVPFSLLVVPAKPTRWELLLRDLGLDDAGACALLGDAAGRGSVAASRIRQWVRQHCRRAFVPELVLQALDVSEAEVLSADWNRAARAARRRASVGRWGNREPKSRD